MEITLYDLTDSYINVLALIDNDKKDDEKEILKIEEELKNALDNIDEAIEQKAENIANILDECKGNSKKIEEQIKRLEKRKKSFDSTTDYLTDYLKKEMLKIDKTKFKTAFHTFYFKKNLPRSGGADGGAIEMKSQRATHSPMAQPLDDIIVQPDVGDLSILFKVESMKSRFKFSFINI